MANIRVTFYLNSGLTKSTTLVAESHSKAQIIVRDNFYNQAKGFNGVLYKDDTKPEESFEIEETYVESISYKVVDPGESYNKQY